MTSQTKGFLALTDISTLAVIHKPCSKQISTSSIPAATEVAPLDDHITRSDICAGCVTRG